MQEDSEIISGSELSDTAKPAEEGKELSAVSNRPPKPVKTQKRGMWFGGLAFVLLVLAGGVFFVKPSRPPAAELKTAPVAKTGKTLTKYDSFVIPFNGNSDYGYIFLSLSFFSAEPAVGRELVDRQNQLRGAIYDLIKRQSDQPGWFPVLGSLKDVLEKTMNEKLAAGKIDELYITQFLVV